MAETEYPLMDDKGRLWINDHIYRRDCGCEIFTNSKETHQHKYCQRHQLMMASAKKEADTE